MEAHRKGDKIGVGIIGCGRIGYLRGCLARRNPHVGFIGVCDLVAEKAAELASKIQAEYSTRDFGKLLARPEIDAVIVSTSEESHFDPVSEAIKSNRPVLVEKPFVLDLREARDLLALSQRQGVDLYVGYTQRFRRRFLSAKEKLQAGFLKRVNSIFAKIYVTRGVAEAVLSRAPKTTPSVNTLTYILDLLLWYLEDTRPIRVYAQSSSGILKQKFNSADATWAIINFENGAVATVGVSWELPSNYPASVATMEFELFGSEGAFVIDDSHRDVILASSATIPCPYVPEIEMNVMFPGSAMPGEWALGHFWGPMKDETDAFLDAAAGSVRHPVLPTGHQGLKVLELCLAIDKSAREGRVLDIGAEKSQ